MENEPLIPADTPFLLTTNPKYAAEALAQDPESGIQINIVANDRYFDRPDVLKAFREQAVIQTPEYEAISESISGVGGRFRPRNQEEVRLSDCSIPIHLFCLPPQAIIETSDLAYEKRHKRFEKFEKRQRYREKEKLKHEHYKLKERIEQLRIMDPSTFMTLSASSFTHLPQDLAENLDETPNSPYIPLNGGVHIMEGERRRNEMLDVAIKLEKRYAYLLPPRKVPDVSSSTFRDTDSRDGEDSDTEQDSVVSKAPKPRVQSVKPSGSTTPSRSPAASRPSAPKKSWVKRQPASTNRQRSVSTSVEPPDIISSVEDKEKSPPSIIVVDDESESDRQPSQPPSAIPSSEQKQVSDAPAEIPASERASPIVEDEIQRVADAPMEIWDETPPVDIVTEEESQVLRPQVDDIQGVENPTLPNEAQEPASENLATGFEMEKFESGTAEAVMEPELTAEQPPAKKRRGRRKAVLPKETIPEQETPETRVRRRRLRQDDDVAGPSSEQPEVISGIRLEAVAPPAKRRKYELDLQVESISAAGSRPISTSDIGIAAISANPYSMRGKTYVAYVDSRTGATVHTCSLLIIGSVRALEKTVARRARDNISFGTLTPDFGKGPAVNYELQQEILDFRDKSPAANESAVVLDVGDKKPEEKRDNDADAEEGQEVTDPAIPQTPKSSLSNEGDKAIESEGGAAGPGDLGPTQTPNDGKGKSPNHGLYQEQSVASPEAEPEAMPQLLPSFRPRRRAHEEDEELIWTSD